jgi:hypothetical protein
MPNYDLVAGDGGSKLRVTIKDNVTNELVDLTGKTVKVRYSINGGTLQQRDMTALDQTASKGQAEYLFLAADLSATGEMKGEVRLQHGLADQLTTVDTFYLKIKAPLA